MENRKEKNELLEEIWNARKEIGEQNHNDIDLIYKKYKARQEKNPGKYFNGNPAKLNRLRAA